MNREELYEEYSNQYPLIMGFREVTYEDWLQKQVIDLRTNKPLPPAEGAETILHRHIDKQSMDELSVNVWPDILEAMQEFASQPQPTAEGAEEILTKHLGSLMPLKYGVKYNKMIDAMREFAALHAQRIAEKMVSERNNTNYDMKPIEVTMDYAIKKLKKLIRVQRTCPQGHGKMKKTSFGPYWCLNCQKYYE